MENKFEKVNKLTDTKFKRIVGVKRKTFQEMLEILEKSFLVKHAKGGRPPKLSLENQLLLALKYLHQYGTFAELGINYGVAESTANNIVIWAENVPIKSKKIYIPGRKILLKKNDIEVILVDVTECLIERPKKQKKFYSGKKKRQTLKILAIVNANGKTHDFKMYKNSIGKGVFGKIKLIGDSGFQGITDLHSNSETPKKKPKNGELTKIEKRNNKRISVERIAIENVNAVLKVFKIITNRYRNRHKRYGLRTNLICGICNFELE
jgi:hypothetical protein